MYSGPIGAVLTPGLWDEPKARELANASSSCGACFEACPVRIPLHDMLVHQRRRNVEARPGASAERFAFRAWALLFSRAWLYRWGMRLGRAFRKLFFGKSTPRRLPVLPAVNAWARYRALPLPAAESFRERLKAERRNEKG